jgi:hypothetical protein
MDNQTTSRVLMGVALCAAALWGSAASAQTTDTRTSDTQTRTVMVSETEVVRAAPSGDPTERHPMMLYELTGAYGVQFGSTEYLPSGSATDYQHPLVHGFGVGGTAGVFLQENLAVIANYEYSRAQSREGSVPGVIDEVQGVIDYHTIVAGLRLRVPVGFGAFQAELAGGVVLPFESVLDVRHGAMLSQLGITGTGQRISHYSIGFGGHALIGYEIPILDWLYVATNVKLRTFESENAGETTEYRNFVTDYAAVPPTATTATVQYGDGATRPSTYSVQDVRFQLAVGARF